MKSINILGDRNLTLAAIQTMQHTDAVRTYYVSDDRFCVEYPNGHLFFDFNTDLSDWQDELEKLPFQAAAVITLVYQNAANVRHVLTQPDFPKNVYVDNDFGVLLPLHDYIESGMPMEEQKRQASRKKHIWDNKYVKTVLFVAADILLLCAVAVEIYFISKQS